MASIASQRLLISAYSKRLLTGNRISMQCIGETDIIQVSLYGDILTVDSGSEIPVSGKFSSEIVLKNGNREQYIMNSGIFEYFVNFEERVINGISETIDHSQYCVMNKNIITIYVNGYRSGYSFMYENVVLLNIIHYQNDKRHGIYIYFKEDGTALTKYFKNGTETAKENIGMYHSIPDEG
ncbi:MAG: hypothetical protein P8N18_05235 [Hellea sp.]|nr:hypothetical protein [Hellea sp.]